MDPNQNPQIPNQPPADPNQVPAQPAQTMEPVLQPTQPQVIAPEVQAPAPQPVQPVQPAQPAQTPQALPGYPEQNVPAQTYETPEQAEQSLETPQQSAAPSQEVQTNEPPAPTTLRESLKGYASIVQLLGGALLLALVINSFVFQSYQVFGASMSPTLHEGDRLIISKVKRSVSGVTGGDYLPDRGDVIVFQSTINPETQLVKRVIGVPGDHVVVQDGRITVYNDENPDGFDPDQAEELNLDKSADEADYTVGEGQLFVSGDNRTPGGSLDSRNDLGLVPIDNVAGELVLRIFPINQAKFF